MIKRESMLRKGNDIYYDKMKVGQKIIDQRDKSIKNYVAIFDIDDTILNTNDIIIEPIYKLYNYALSNNIRTIFITAREGNKDNIKHTIKQLKRFNIKGYDLLYLRPPHMKNIEKFKLYARMNVVECGYTPLFSIGDMYWDVGEFGGESIHIC